MTDFSDAQALLTDGVAARAFPAAVAEAGRAAGPVWTAAVGRLTYDADAPPTTAETIFDLASLTKVIATTTLAMRAVDDGRLSLDEPLRQRLPHWRGIDREAVTIRDLLAHSSGLTAYLPFYRDHAGRADFEHAICTLPLEYEPRSRAVYSDLGFILLGFVLEDAAGFAAQFQRLASDIAPALSEGRPRSAPTVGTGLARPHLLTFNPPREWRPRTAPTEVDPWRGRLLVGEVHDENAWALGGVAGHAGLFGTASAVGAFARAALRTIHGDPILARRETMREFIRRTPIPGSSRALGWDTMTPTSSCGTRLSPTSIGHTGFTGTSLWIDWERDLYVVLLTNRVHPTRDNPAIRQIRPKLHDAVVAALEG